MVPEASKYPTRMWNMRSSPATPTMCLEQKSENFQSRNVTLSMPSQSKKFWIWDNLQYCLLVPRSPSKPVMLTIDLQSRKLLFIEIVFGMYNLERQLWYWHLLTRHCPCNLLPESISPKYEYREKLWGHPVTSDVITIKIFFWHNLGRSYHMWGQIEAVFNISKFSKWQPFRACDILFLPEVIPEVKYTRKTDMCISDILSIWSTL